MNQNNKKKITGITSILSAGIVTAGIVAGVTYNSIIEVPYEIKIVNQYLSSLEINMPQKENVDLVELYCNGNYVDNALLPNDKLIAIPLIYTNLDNLSLKMYNHGKQIGTGKFKDDKLIYNR